ncbi:MAG: HTH domain-containing protein [Bacteroidales bacterium]|nr:HTH domain-containing protein [Bacteroidales bacterium]
MGRLWQSPILGKLHPIFEHLPIENMVYSNQQKYYDAITESTKCVDCSPFIDFMLNEILNTLKKYQDVKIENKIPNKTLKQHPDITETTWEVLSQIINNPKVTANEMSFYLGISDRMIRKHIKILRDNNIIKRIGGNRTGHWEIL